MVIVDRVVLDAADVPKGDCVGAPAEAAGEFGPPEVAIEKTLDKRIERAVGECYRLSSRDKRVIEEALSPNVC
jgi:hypothetical protein